jgi:hypothetical protein
MSGDRPEVVVLVGLQASGKSTFFRQRFAGTHVRIGKDLMRNGRRKEARQHALLTRNVARQGRARVPDVGVFATLARLERPGIEEGFDRLFVVRAEPGGSFVCQAVE